MSHDALSLILVTPNTSKSFAGITVDAFKVVSGGRTLASLLEHVLDGENSVENIVNDDTGAQETMYTLRIPAGAGIALPLRPVGEIGVAHKAGGVLSITCPKALEGVFAELLDSTDVRTTSPQTVAHRDGTMTQFFVKTTPGMSFGLALPKMGSLRVIRP